MIWRMRVCFPHSEEPIITRAVLASYDLVRAKIDEFDDLAWSVVFLDEAHKIKNHKSGITKAFNKFNCHVRFGLTVSAAICFRTNQRTD